MKNGGMDGQSEDKGYRQVPGMIIGIMGGRWEKVDSTHRCRQERGSDCAK